MHGILAYVATARGAYCPHKKEAGRHEDGAEHTEVTLLQVRQSRMFCQVNLVGRYEYLVNRVPFPAASF